MDTLVFVKLFSLFSVLLLSFFSSILPWFLSQWLNEAESWISLGNTLSGGVVLGAGMMHMLPDTQNYFPNADYPWATLIASFSVLLLFSIEQLFISQQSSQHDHDNNHQTNINEKYPSQKSKHDESEEQDDMENIDSQQEEPLLGENRYNTSNKHNNNNNNNNKDNNQKFELNSLQKQNQTRIQIEDDPHQVLMAEHEEELQNKKAIMSAYSLLVALSVHSLFEGLGVGSSTSPSSLITTMGALFSHKALEAFALGVGFYRSYQQYIHILNKKNAQVFGDDINSNEARLNYINKNNNNNNSNQIYSENDQSNTHNYNNNNNNDNEEELMNIDVEDWESKDEFPSQIQKERLNQQRQQQMKQAWHNWIILALYSLVTPLGIGIGIAVDEEFLENNTSNETETISNQWASGIMSGLATGSFLFVAFFEMLPEEFNGKRTKTKLALVVFGWAAMAILAAFV